MAVEIDALSLTSGLVLLAIMGWDAFTSIVLPRAVGRRLRPSITVIRLLWAAWSALGGLIADRRRRQGMLAVFGPLSVILMLIVWATGLIFAFALLYVGVGAPLRGAVDTGQFARALYLSGTTLFTLGLGDVTPDSALARILVVSEAAIGLGFFAIVISYLPLLEQAFSQREVGVLLLESRAGSPPNGVRLLGRHAGTENTAELLSVLREGERWMAAILESHVAHGVLVFYRSQRLGQSWLTTMVGVLDACALIVVGGRDQRRGAGEGDTPPRRPHRGRAVPRARDAGGARTRAAPRDGPAGAVGGARRGQGSAAGRAARGRAPGRAAAALRAAGDGAGRPAPPRAAALAARGRRGGSPRQPLVAGAPPALTRLPLASYGRAGRAHGQEQT